MIDRVAQQLDYARRTRKCPVCRRRYREPWRDGAGLRVTCGNEECYRKWISGGRYTPEKHAPAANE